MDLSPPLVSFRASALRPYLIILISNTIVNNLAEILSAGEAESVIVSTSSELRFHTHGAG
jgi:predicted transcriptional regulator